MLAGAVVLAGASANFVTSLGVGTAYVFGMVAPLFAVALAWEGRNLGQARWLRAKAVTLSIFGRARYVPVTNLAGGLLLVAIAVITGITAVTGPASPTSGWQLRMATTLQHTAHVLTTGAGHVPGWVTALGGAKKGTGSYPYAVGQPGRDKRHLTSPWRPRQEVAGASPPKRARPYFFSSKKALTASRAGHR